MKKKPDNKKIFFELIESHGERATAFKSKNRELIRIFNHMLGYADVTRHFMTAIHAASEQEYQQGTVDRKKQTLRFKVHISLETTFYNSLYAAVRLLSFGMSRESLILVRTAYEALQYFRLLFFDDTAYDVFETAPLRPVEVRKRLEALGHDPAPIRQKYQELSATSHIGGSGALAFDLHDLDVDLIRVGGYVDEISQVEILHEVVLLTHLFQAFALGISDENAVRYFDEIRSMLSDASLSAADRAAGLLDAIARYRFQA
ncbi:hypothetical protein [Agrobacterium burrii]